MSSEQPWTIDAIAHAIPAPETRQTFLREVNLTPLPDLPAVLARWQRFVEQFDASRPGLEAILDFAKAHNGELPPQYADDGSTEEWLTQWGDSLKRTDTSAA